MQPANWGAISNNKKRGKSPRYYHVRCAKRMSLLQIIYLKSGNSNSSDILKAH
jgi:hypothetical protein